MTDREKTGLRTALHLGVTLTLTLALPGGAGAAVPVGHAFLSTESALDPGTFAPERR